MKRLFTVLTAFFLGVGALFPAHTLGADTPGNFSLQVSPSPIVQTVEPGRTSTATVQIRNTGTGTEELKIGLRSFSVNKDDGKVALNDEQPKDVIDWVSFSETEFTIASGATHTETVTFSVPKDAGFSYSFALLISRAKPTASAPGKTAIEGSVAIFTLLSVNRPGATKSVSIKTFSSKKKVYEFLPGSFTLQLRNGGNTMVAPTGNIFIQKGRNAASPMATLPVNASGAYLLPDVTRSVTSEWSDGFPVYKKAADDSQKLEWNWGNLQKLRIGKYTAKAVVIYNDGQRDVPVEAVVEFWVLPWRLLGGFLVVLVLIVIGVVTTIRKTARLAKHSKEKHEKHDA